MCHERKCNYIYIENSLCKIIEHAKCSSTHYSSSSQRPNKLNMVIFTHLKLLMVNIT